MEPTVIVVVSVEIAVSGAAVQTAVAVDSTTFASVQRHRVLADLTTDTRVSMGHVDTFVTEQPVIHPMLMVLVAMAMLVMDTINIPSWNVMISAAIP